MGERNKLLLDTLLLLLPIISTTDWHDPIKQPERGGDLL